MIIETGKTMIVQSKFDCTGCSACYSICPMRCVSMDSDTEGFLYPVIDERNCTKCKECEKSCPVIVQGLARKPLSIYATKNPNEEVRYNSSSGGVFTMLAEYIVKERGVVFGVRFNDEWEVIHDYTETMEGLATFRGSKYVQSIIGDTYKQAKYFLENGRRVLYSGTPCQIAGLRTYLQNEYHNLLTVDFVCHGVPSPLVWKKYLDELMGQYLCEESGVYNHHIQRINFKDKVNGWYSMTFTISYIMNKYICDLPLADNDKQISLIMESASKNSYMKGFLRDLFLRPSCYRCPARSLKSGSDITIADYWGIRNVLPEFDDGKGVSLVMVNTEIGRQVYGLLDKNDIETTFEDALAGNSTIERNPYPRKMRDKFFRELHDKPIIPLIDRCATFPLRIFLVKVCYALPRKLSMLYKLGLLSFIKKEIRK